MDKSVQFCRCRHFLKAASAAALAVLILGMWGAPQARADFSTLVSDLNQFRNYTVFGLDSTYNGVTTGTTINDSLGTLYGNEAVSHDSKLTVNSFTVNGNIYYQDTGSVTKMAPGTINGSMIQTNLTSAVSAAFDASTQAKNLTQTMTINGNVTTNTPITGNGGLNVIDINGNINLGGSNSLTLTGTASDYFVINVTGSLTMTGNGGLLVSLTGLTQEEAATHVLYNFDGGSASNPGALSFNTGINNKFYGTMLAPYYDMTNMDGTWYGQLVGGPKNITLLSGATVTEAPFTYVPAPPSIVLLGLGALGVARILVRSRRRLVSVE